MDAIPPIVDRVKRWRITCLSFLTGTKDLVMINHCSRQNLNRLQSNLSIIYLCIHIFKKRYYLQPFL